jgi:hypothetical protein
MVRTAARLGTSRLRRSAVAFDDALLTAPAQVLEHPTGHEDLALTRK